MEAERDRRCGRRDPSTAYGFAKSAAPAIAGVDLYWLPLGAGGDSVRLNGRVFEAVAALLDRRPARDLYHVRRECGCAP